MSVELRIRQSPGMDAATQARIFEPCFSTKGDAGTGLRVITVTSAPGAGASFAERAVDLLQHADGFDRLVSDMVLPRMSGIALAEHARRTHPRVLLMSGYADVKIDGHFRAAQT